jgi:hypothetical protein
MTEGVTLHLSTRARSRFVAKIVVACAIGVTFAVFFNKSQLADYEKGQQLTLAQYTADFQVFKANLMEHHWPLAGDVALWIALLTVFLGIYELLSAGIATLLERLLPESRSPHVGDLRAVR